MPKTRVGSRLMFWLPVLCLALAPAIGTVDDAAAPALEAPAAAPSDAAALLPANSPPTLKALGGAGSVSAASDDAGIATVSVNGAEIVVSGVSAGRTEIAVKPTGSEFRVPVRVGGG